MIKNIAVALFLGLGLAILLTKMLDVIFNPAAKYQFVFVYPVVIIVSLVVGMRINTKHSKI